MTARTNSHHSWDNASLLRNTCGSLNAVVFIRKAALSLGFSVNFIPSSLTKMLLTCQCSWLPFTNCHLTLGAAPYEVYRPMGTSWSPLSSCPSSSTQKLAIASQQLLHNPKGTWVTSPAPDCLNVLHIWVSLVARMSLRERRWRLSEMELFFHRKQTYQNVLLQAWWSWYFRGSKASQAGYATAHLIPTLGKLMPL